MQSSFETNLAKRSRRNQRDLIEVMGDILNVCQQETRRTHVIYKANLSSTMLQQYLSHAKRAGLLEEVGAGKFLHITEKGRHFLTEYSVIQEILQMKGEVAGRAISNPHISQ